MVNIAFMDLEADGLDPTEIHCIAVKTKDMPKPILLDDKSFLVWAETYKPKKWVMHNGLGYDCWVVNKLIKKGLINPRDVIDTQVVSKTVNYNAFQTHSLKELGEFLGVFKGDYTGGWEVFTEEMGEYCIQDVVVLEAIFEYFKPQIFDPSWAEAFRLEHDTAIISQDMQNNGFYFDRKEAAALLEEVNGELNVLERELQSAFVPTLEEVKRIKYRTRKDGTLFSNVVEAQRDHPMSRVEGEELICYDYIPFKPSSKNHRIDRLWEAGWKPTDMTDGHKKYLKGLQQERRGGWSGRGR